MGSYDATGRKGPPPPTSCYWHDNRDQYDSHHRNALTEMETTTTPASFQRHGLVPQVVVVEEQEDEEEEEEDEETADAEVAVMEHNNDDDEEEEAVQKAAALLLRASGVSEFLFTELCSSCASLVQLRLRDLASGTNLQFLKGKNCEHSDENGVCTNGNSVVNADKELHSLNNNSAASKTRVGVNGAHVQRITLENYNPTDKDGKSPVANRISELTARNAAQAVSESDVPQGSEDSGSVKEGVTTPSQQLSVAEREQRRLLGLKVRKDFMCMERVDGRLLNVVEGLELHMGVFSAAEQTRLVNMVYDFQTKGRQQQLRERTYSEPRKWMRGKGRITIQFGCCYNYATDKYGNPPGILHEEAVDPLPQLLRNTIKRLVRWHVLPTTCVPDSCIINIYDEGDCIPPHIDHHDFVRPFCTLSLLSECCILFGENLKIVGPGSFDGPVSIPLPVGSVLVLKGNGADVAKHAVPAVPTRRISITFRKMDPLKVPLGFVEDKELQGPCWLPPLKVTEANSRALGGKRVHFVTRLSGALLESNGEKGISHNGSNPSGNDNGGPENIFRKWFGL